MQTCPVRSAQAAPFARTDEEKEFYINRARGMMLGGAPDQLDRFVRIGESFRRRDCFV
jgi:hypothetical protein